MPRQPSFLQRYSVAIGVVLLAFALRYWLYGALDHRIPFGFFLSATIIAAWYGGLGPGLLAAVAGLLLGDYFFLPRHSAGTVMGEAERTAIGLYAMNCAIVVLLFWRMHMRVAQAAHELKKISPAGEQPAK
jgi:K+-sensing histidine kinase KdpD